MTDRAGRVVVVTGGSRGIGRATALAFAGEAAAVAICGRDQLALDEVLRELSELHVKAVAQVVDVADEAAVNAFANHVTSRCRSTGTPTRRADSSFEPTA